MHTVAATPAKVNALNMAGAAHAEDEEAALGDAGDQGVYKRPEVKFPFAVHKRQVGFIKGRYRRGAMAHPPP